VTGKCNRCGECCKVIPILLKGIAPETKEWLMARGAKEDTNQGYLLIPHVCQQLIENAGEITCAIHDTDQYPLACARYHGFGHFYKPEGCGYLKV